VASGDVVVSIYQIQPPLSNFAGLTVKAGSSSPTERVPVWAFDASIDEYLDFYCTLQGYGGGGLTFQISWMAATATTGGALLALAIRPRPENSDAITAAWTYDYNEVRVVAPSTLAAWAYDTITFTNGTDMANLANGQDFILRLRRRGSDSTASTGDDMAGDLYVVGVVGLET